MNPLAIVTNGMQSYIPEPMVIYPLYAELISVIYLTN